MGINIAMYSNDETKDRHRIAVLVITTISSFLIPFMASSVVIALPTIAGYFQMNAVLITWVSTAYILTSASLMVPLGRLSDMHGRKKIFLGGYIIFLAGSLLSVVVQSSGLFLFSRVIQGVGASAVVANSVAILTAAFPKRHRGRVLGINAAAVYIGLSVSPLLGGLLTEHLGWRSIFFLSAGLCLAMVIATAIMLPEYEEPRRDRFDLPGTIVYMATLTLFMYGLSILPSRMGVSFIAASLCGILLFVRLEKRAASPIIDFRLFMQNRGFAFSNIAALVHYSGTYSIAFLLSLYLQFTKGLSAGEAGLVLITNPIVQALFSPIFGRLSDRVEPRLLSSAGMAVTCAGILVLSFLTVDTKVIHIVGCQVLIGFGFAMFASPNTNAIMSSIEKHSYGFAAATMGTMRQLGMTLSMGIAMVVFAIVIGKETIVSEHQAAFIAGVRLIFTIAAVLCFVAVFASLARGDIHEQKGLIRR